MLWFFGFSERGRIDQVGGSAIVTRFFVINGIPIFPIGSVLLADDGRGAHRVRIPLVWRSVVAAYGRVLLPLLAALLGLIGSIARSPLMLAGAFALLAAGLYAWRVLGRLSPSEVRRRLAYAVWAGAAVDIALIPEPADHPFVPHLQAYLDDRATLVPEAYRDRLDAGARWRVAAQESSDPELLIAALARARWERRTAQGEARASLDALHDALWAKLSPLLAAGNGPPAYAGWERYARERSGAARSAVLFATAALGALAAAIAGGAVLGYRAAMAKVVIVNVSGVDGVTVLLDGTQVAGPLPTMRREGDDASVTTRVEHGSHELVARGADGAELDRRRVELTKGTRALLYAPGRSPDACFVEEIVTYSSVPSLQAYEAVQLVMPSPVRPFRERIDHWFEPAPENVKGARGRATIEKRTVRVGPCEAKRRD
ncbi:hypothetical protein [Sorangium sp. So ce1024]|uniref:hypothetical protein n=1 Tax=Sorangium sp. So ce1024 TaxID=3133327 RepID=UPI003F021BD1